MFRTIRIFALALAVVAILAACSGAAATPGVATLDDPEASGSPGASPSATLNPQDAFLAYAQCMRENGIDMPDPQVSEDGSGETRVTISGGEGPSNGGAADKATFEKADTACRHFLASVTQDGNGFQMSAEDQDKMLQFARCMREHGVDMPDPDFSGGGAIIKGGPGDDGPGAFDPDSDEFQAAQEACQSLLPGGGKGGSLSADGGPSSGGGVTLPGGTVNK
jgi:hypothetical protein